MSERLLRFLLSELTTVRIRCLKCGVVTEIALSALAAKGPAGLKQCPHCGHDFDPTDSGRSHLVEFAQAATTLASLKKTLEVEFTLPLDEDEAPKPRKSK